jgi:4-hydroxy-3-polyprenylbenzoate decarboxylase
VREVHAVDASGVHPLLLALGSERYTPYMPTKQPAELLTIANHILGTGQLSLAKFLFITADETLQLHTHDVQAFMEYLLERIDLTRDVHFYTHTTIDTLDYSGTGLNSGSKVVFAAYGEKIRTLATEVPSELKELQLFRNPQVCMPGVIALEAPAFTTYAAAQKEMEILNGQLESAGGLDGVPFIVLTEDASFAAATLNNYLWVTYTRCNPSHDIYGVGETVQYKHWGCRGPLIIDARRKPHHAPVLEKDPQVEKRIDRIFARGGSLAGLI